MFQLLNRWQMQLGKHQFMHNTSEYSQKFCPMEARSYDASTFHERETGSKSNELATCFEPPLQHKKRLDGPPTSLSSNYFSVPSGNEFAILGRQDKFSDNVPYNLKNTASPSKIYKNKENFDDPPPVSKQLKMQKRIKPLIKERHPPVIRSPPRQPASENTPKSPPPAPRKEKLPEPVKEALKDKNLKDVLGEDTKKKTEPAMVKESEPSSSKANQNRMNEFVQTDMKKGLAISGPEAPSEYALKYKAGVAPPRPPKKVSEYQKQFQWKDGMKASPLLAAEQIVYRSSTDLGPYKSDAVPKMSEYKRQFQPWKSIDINAADLSLKLDTSINSGEQEKEPKKKKAKRSKSAGAVLRNANKTVEKEKEDQQDEAEELKAKLKQTHGKIRRLGTEYDANFKAPAKYTYVKGAWKGANPPQLTPAAGDSNPADNESKKKEDVDSPLNNWFAEVIELRRRADEYRKRAQGTHFSREHLVQLMARQTECWDLDSQESSTIQALDLQAPKINKRIIGSEEIESNNDPREYSPMLSEVDEEPIKKEKGKRTEKKRKREAPRNNKTAYLEEQKKKVAQQQQKVEEEIMMDEENECEDGSEGRQPTPVLKQGKGSVRRHHLDLTTPAVGGALLTCPPSKNNKMIVTSRSGDSYVTASDDYEQSPKKTYNMEKLITMPILGMPSGDTHALRDEEASVDKVMETRYVPTPLHSCGEEDKENAPQEELVKRSGKGKNKGQHATKPGQLSSIQENGGKTFAKLNPAVTLDDIKTSIREPDDDVMSVSMMSVASSSSLASEVLERARRRREEFWGKKD